LQVSKQGSTAYGDCKVWKQELSTLSLPSLAFLLTRQLMSLIVFLFRKFQEEVFALCCLLLAMVMRPS